MNFLMWASFVAELANTIAANPDSPINARAKGYLSVLVAAVRGVAITDAELTQLKTEYAAATAENRPVMREELLALDARITDVSRQIQAG